VESDTIESESLVSETQNRLSRYLSTTGHVKPCGNLGGPPSKAKYQSLPIVNKYREGKVKRTPGGE